MDSTVGNKLPPVSKPPFRQSQLYGDIISEPIMHFRVFLDSGISKWTSNLSKSQLPIYDCLLLEGGYRGSAKYSDLLIDIICK